MIREKHPSTQRSSGGDKDGRQADNTLACWQDKTADTASADTGGETRGGITRGTALFLEHVDPSTLPEDGWVEELKSRFEEWQESHEQTELSGWSQ